MTGSEHNDEFYVDEHGRIRTRTNRSGGIQVDQLVKLNICMSIAGTHANMQYNSHAYIFSIYPCMQGGISNGEIIHMRVAFKPTPTITVSHHHIYIHGKCYLHLRVYILSRTEPRTSLDQLLTQ